MCIIAAKAAGVKMPTEETLRRMFRNNPDGAGLMYVTDGRVRIEKGFMTADRFMAAVHVLESKLDLTKTPVVMHFRITTHGGTSMENTHPFPITDSVGMLKKIMCNTDIGVAHNGIIDIRPRKGISDTMEYIASQLAPLKRALPRFYENKDAMCLVKNAIDSRMAFLTKEGRIYTIGDFVESGGMLYSNHSFEPSYGSFRNYCGSWWDTYDERTGTWGTKGIIHDPKVEKTVTLEWMDYGEYAIGPDGDLISADDGLLIDINNHVWVCDYSDDFVEELAGYRPMTENGTPRHFNPEGFLEDLPIL